MNGMSPGYFNSRRKGIDIESSSFRERIVANDLDAFRKLFETVYQELYGYGIKFCGRPQLVKDKIQEVFLRLWERGEAAGEISSIKTYLLISFRRELLKHLEKERSSSTLEDKESVKRFELSTVELIIKNERIQERHVKLNEALNNLSPKLREVIYLKYYHGLSYEEMEQVLEIRYQSIRNNMYRAVKKLREMLGDSVSEILLCLLLVIDSLPG